MKYCKITLNQERNTIVYPFNYKQEIGDFAIEHLYYEDNGVLKLLLCIQDKDYKDTIVRKDVVEISETEVKAISETNENRTETIKDEAKLRRIELKVAMGLILTKDETDSVDITKPTSIFGVNEILADKIERLKTNETKT